MEETSASSPSTRPSRQQLAQLSQAQAQRIYSHSSSSILHATSIHRAIYARAATVSYPSPYSPMDTRCGHRTRMAHLLPAPSKHTSMPRAPPPGQLAPYALRPYAYAPWAPYANGSIEANWFDASAQAHVPTQAQTKSQRAKRGWGVADQLAPGEDGLRIVMMQPKGFSDIDVAASPASSVTSSSASESRPTQTIPEPSMSCSSQSLTKGPPHAEESSANSNWPASATATGFASAVSDVFIVLFIATSITLTRFPSSGRVLASHVAGIYRQKPSVHCASAARYGSSGGWRKRNAA
ncbi:hypothetical protein EI94DRAFT_875686 [Lactarius quietus]|nr:hypothetical protein EI94DRAFT_875686 [Lactarius quietus]